MSFPKKINSNIIAAVVTISIHVVLITILSANLGNMSSSKKHEDTADDEMLLQLETLLSEDIDIAPQSIDTKSTNENNPAENTSESTSNDNGKIKPTTNELPEAIENEDIPLEIPDTIIVKKEQLAVLKTDTIKLEMPDSIIATFIQETKKIQNRNSKTTAYMTHQERFEFYKNNYKLVRNFKKVYPYALKTRELIENLNSKLGNMSNESDKKKLIKETEQMLFKQYESAVRSMSTSQGKLLLKLIARETNRTGYDIIKDYKGAFSATFWYGVGKIFGTDLKSEYKRQEEDSLIESVLDKYNKNDLY